MPQISRPLLIALVAAVGFAAVWMTVLRPQAQDERANTAAAAPAVTAPGAAGLGHAIKRAHGAASASAASDARTQQAAAQASSAGSPTSTGASAATPAAGSAGAAATTAKKTPVVPIPSARAHPTVLLFAGKGADDAVARRVVRSVHRRGVRTIVTSIDHLARYRELTGGIEIESLPTILVIGTKHNARRIVGLPDRAQVVQALDSAGR